jgi:hypothetical protein
MPIVDVLPCGHVAVAGTSRMCRHLFGSAGEEHVGLLTGRGLDFDVCCPACDRAAQAGSEPDLVPACEACLEPYLNDVDHRWLVAWRGSPEVLERPEAFDPTVVDVPVPVRAVDLVPVADKRRSVWLLLDDEGRIGRFIADTGEWTMVARATVPEEPDHQPWAGHALRRRLHASPRGDFAAVVNDFGRYGQVIDLRTGQSTVALDGGDYCAETVPLSVAFIEHRGRIVVVHRTAWNRLDVTDAGTGELLTARQLPDRRGDEPIAEHDLNYFHGTLYASPDGHRLADDGWVWHPIGIPCVWEVGRWLDDNVWESEDGPSRLDLCQRDYHWNVPMCWTAEDRLAVSGIGGDDEAMLAGVRVFDVTTGAEGTAFAGPTGGFFADGRRLFAANPTGLETWDLDTGERNGVVPGFVPTRHHTGAGELAGLGAGVLRRWALPREARG